MASPGAPGQRGRSVAARIAAFRTLPPAAPAARRAEAGPLPDSFWWNVPSDAAEAAAAARRLRGADQGAAHGGVSLDSGPEDASASASAAALRARHRVSLDAPPAEPAVVGWARVARTSGVDQGAASAVLSEEEEDDEGGPACAPRPGAASPDGLRAWRAARHSDAGAHMQAVPPCCVSPPPRAPLSPLSPLLPRAAAARASLDSAPGSWSALQAVPPAPRSASPTPASVSLPAQPPAWTGGWVAGGPAAVDELLEALAALNAALRSDAARAAALFADCAHLASGRVTSSGAPALLRALLPRPCASGVAAGAWALLDAGGSGEQSLPQLRASAAASASAALALETDGTPPLRRLGAALEARTPLAARAFEAEGGAARRLPPLAAARAVAALADSSSSDDNTAASSSPAPPSELRALQLALLACAARAPDGMVSLVDTLRAALGGAPRWLSEREARRRDAAATRLQAAARGRSARRHAAVLAAEAVSARESAAFAAAQAAEAAAVEAARRERAAVAVQAAARGRSARRTASELRARRFAESAAEDAIAEAMRNIALESIRRRRASRIIRAAGERWAALLKQRRDAAASAIQAAVRRRRARRIAAAEAAAKAEAEVAAAAESARASALAHAAAQRAAEQHAAQRAEAEAAERQAAEAAAAAAASAWSSEDEAPPRPPSPAPAPVPAAPSAARVALVEMQAAAAASAARAQACAAEAARHAVLAAESARRDAGAQLAAALRGGPLPHDPALASLVRELMTSAAEAQRSIAATAAGTSYAQMVLRGAVDPVVPPALAGAAEVVPPEQEGPPEAAENDDVADETQDHHPPRLRGEGRATRHALHGSAAAAAAVSAELDALLRRLAARAAGIDSHSLLVPITAAEEETEEDQPESDAAAADSDVGDAVAQLAEEHRSATPPPEPRLSAAFAAWEGPTASGWAPPAPSPPPPPSASPSPPRARPAAAWRAPPLPPPQPDWAAALPPFVAAAAALAPAAAHGCGVPVLLPRAPRDRPSAAVRALCGSTWAQYEAVFGRGTAR